jgi:integral membrane protein
MANASRTTFEWVAILEGVSLLVLLCIAMPLKYLAGLPLAVRVVGLVHGLAFLAYAKNLLEALATGQWLRRTVLLGLLAGFVPGGTFFFLHRLRRSGPLQRCAPLTLE